MCFIGITYISQSRISRWYTWLVQYHQYSFEVYFHKKEIYYNYNNCTSNNIDFDCFIFESGVNSVFDLITAGTSGDAYFAGPVSVNNAIGLAKSCSVGITNIIYDFLIICQ